MIGKYWIERFARVPVEVDYASERGDRLEERAAGKQREADSRLGRARAIADNIPLGQPILVGHHSEKRHRRDIERIHTGFQKGFEAQAKAQSLASRAESSRAHQEAMQSAPVIARRIKKLEKEQTVLEGRMRDYPGEATRWNAMLTDLRNRLADQHSALEQLGGAPGQKTDEGDVCAAGDLILINGFEVRVTRVNPTTISGVIATGGASGMSGKWDRTKFQKLLKAVGSPEAGKAIVKAIAEQRDAVLPEKLLFSETIDGVQWRVEDQGAGMFALQRKKPRERSFKFCGWVKDIKNVKQAIENFLKRGY